MDTRFSLYTDGGCVRSNPSKYAGQWAYCHVNTEGVRIKEMSGIILRAVSPETCQTTRPDRIIVVPSGEINPNGITNQLSELVSLTLGVESLPKQWAGHIYSDSESALHRMFNGESMGGIPEEWQHRCLLAKENIGEASWTLLGGHPTKADLACGIRAARSGKRALPCSVHQEWCDLECQRLANRFIEIIWQRESAKQ